MVEIGNLVSPLLEEGGEIFRHPHRQGGDQHPLIFRDPLIELHADIIHLPFRRLDDDQRVEQSGRTDDLFHHLAIGMIEFIVARGCGTVDHLGLLNHLLEFIKAHRPVFQGRGKTEAVFHERFLPLPVAVVHAPDLGQGDMRLIDDQQHVIGEIVEEIPRPLAEGAAVDMHGIVFDAGAVAVFPQGFDIEVGPLLKALRFQKLVVGVEILESLLQLRFDLIARPQHLIMAAGIAAGREDVVELVGVEQVSGQRIDLGDPFDLIAEHLDADVELVGIARGHIDHITPHPQGSPGLIHVIAAVLQIHKAADQCIPVIAFPHPEGEEHVLVLGGVARGVDAGNAGHDDRVMTLEQRVQGGFPEHVELFVDRRRLFDVHVVFRHVGLRLVVIEIRHKKLYPVMGKEFLEFAVQLSCQRLVVREHQGRAIDPCDDVRHGKGLAGAGGAFKNLFFFSFLQPSDQRIDRRRLIAFGLKGTDEFK